jgi:hypothetical protein
MLVDKVNEGLDALSELADPGLPGAIKDHGSGPKVSILEIAYAWVDIHGDKPGWSKTSARARADDTDPVVFRGFLNILLRDPRTPQTIEFKTARDPSRTIKNALDQMDDEAVRFIQTNGYLRWRRELGRS